VHGSQRRLQGAVEWALAVEATLQATLLALDRRPERPALLARVDELAN
jgi:hypothetical protein